MTAWPMQRILVDAMVTPCHLMRFLPVQPTMFLQNRSIKILHRVTIRYTHIQATTREWNPCMPLPLAFLHVSPLLLLLSQQDVPSKQTHPILSLSLHRLQCWEGRRERGEVVNCHDSSVIRVMRWEVALGI